MYQYKTQEACNESDIFHDPLLFCKKDQVMDMVCKNVDIELTTL